MKLSLLGGLLLAALPTALSSSDCRCTPSDPCWPSEKQWKAFNSSISGVLAKVKPAAHICHKPDFDKEGCKEMQKIWPVTNFRAGHPGAVQHVNWEQWPAEEESCYVDTPKGDKCEQGRISPYSVLAETPFHVQEAVRFAKKHNLKVSVKASGHDFAGRSVAPHSLQILTFNMKGMTIVDDFVPRGSNSSEGTAVIVESGIGLREMYDTVATRNLSVVGGLSHTVAAAGGYIQGGGHSPLGPWKGMASDNALEFELVTADGEFVVANEYQNPDLFWALRGGGGGTFGVVLSATLRAFPDAPVTMSSISVNVTMDAMDSYWAAVKQLHTHLPSINDAGASGYYFIVPVPAPIPGSKPKGKPQATLNVVLIFLNETDTAAVDKVVNPLLSALKDIDGAEAGGITMPLPSTSTMIDSMLPGEVGTGGGINIAIGSRLFSHDFLSSDDGPAKLTEAMASFKQQPGRTFTGHVVGGGQVAANADVVDSALHPAWRRTLTHITFGEGWGSKTPFEESAAIHKNITEVEGPLFKALEPDMGAYLNEADAFEPNHRDEFWGCENYKKLLGVKRDWDPEDLFMVRGGVGSENWDDEGLCRKD